MTFELPKLPFEANALEPIISKKTLEYHYGKHHQGYVTKLNGLLPGSKFEHSSLEEIIKNADGEIFNNGSQVWNHTFYWNSLKPKNNELPKGDLKVAIEKHFGSFEVFKEKFTNAAATLFGSGWAWLVKNSNGVLEIIKESNAGNPLRNGFTPLLTFDVWEHAYYLDYQNKRPDHINALWNLVNWDIVRKRYEE